jgi:DNA-binding GntR family transcriptional regulator
VSITHSAPLDSQSAVPGFLARPTARKSLTKADAAYEEIRARILSCDLPPDSVIDYDLLAGWLGSSPTPVREALRRLEAEQLVSVRAHSHVRVAPVSIEEFREFHAIRLGLEPLAAEQAASSASDAEIAALRQLQEEAGAGAAGGAGLGRSRAFHRAIYSAAGNQTLTQVLDNIWDRVGRYRVIFAKVGAASRCNSPEHAQIIEALEARDGKLAGERLRSDLEVTFNEILPISGEALKPYL